MPPDADTLINPSLPVGERLVALEVRVQGLKDDTSTIRSTLHDQANEMQKFVAAELQCVSQLKAITETLTGHTTVLAALTATKEHTAGAKSMIRDIGAFIRDVFPTLAIIAAGVYWLWTHGGGH